MRAGIGNVGKINGKVFFAIVTPVDGKDEINVNGSSGFDMADVVKSSCCRASSRATLSAGGTRSVLSVPCPPLLVGRRQMDGIVYSNDRIGMIFTGTRHNVSILAGLESEGYAISKNW